MLGKIDLNKAMPTKEFKKMSDDWEVRLGELQRKAKECNIPVMVVFEGWSASGKGTLINKLIHPLDPRGFQVYTTQEPSVEEKMRPFLWRFWTKTPAYGRIHLFDRSWYQKLITEKPTPTAYHDIMNFEEQLVEDGLLLIKFFLHISKKEQSKRFKKLESNKETSWRVTKADKEKNKNYEKVLKRYDEILTKTDTSFAPWTIVEATNLKYATGKIMTVFGNRLEEAIRKKETKIEKGKKERKEWVKEEKASDEVAATGSLNEPAAFRHGKVDWEAKFRNGVLNGVDLSVSLEKPDYKKELGHLQKRLAILHNEMYLKRIPVILAFEGWDAAGKGGAIKRITEYMDPRGYEVVPVAAPNDMEKAHHYLWRFWSNIPKAGHMTIFDRTWYGRVLVERIEGFCSADEWRRAYNEINQMEENLYNAGYVLHKFWLHIDKDEQEARFKARQENPEKVWKITDEDWRNREKWEEYEKAVDEMIVRTSTPYAPWTIVEANSKYYARVKVLRTLVEALEKRMDG